MLNQVNFIGNVGRIEIKELPQGRVANFSLAISMPKDQTMWLDVQAWAKLTDICERFVTKGSKVCVTGRLQSRTYENKDGIKVTKFEVVASQVIALSPKEKPDDQGSDIDFGSPDLPF